MTTKKQDAELQRIGRDFKKKMEGLGLGVRIKAGDDDWITVTEPPEEEEKKPE